MSADALNRVVQRAVTKAIPKCPDLAQKHVTPHVIRHTTALHLLQSGVDIAVIALWLGHESIETTHGYGSRSSVETACPGQTHACRRQSDTFQSWRFNTALLGRSLSFHTRAANVDSLRPPDYSDKRRRRNCIFRLGPLAAPNLDEPPSRPDGSRLFPL